MSKCEHLIGEVISVGDYSDVICADELTKHFSLTDIEKIKQDIRLNGGWDLYKFNYCPICGEQIDWDKILN